MTVVKKIFMLVTEKDALVNEKCRSSQKKCGSIPRKSLYKAKNARFNEKGSSTRKSLVTAKIVVVNKKYRRK